MEDGTKVYMCLGRMYTYEEIMLLNEYKMFVKHNILPKPGHLDYQNSKTIDAFNFIESEIYKNEVLKRKELEAKNGKPSSR